MVLSVGAALHEMGEGVLVLLDTGVFALSGKTGEELRSYHDRDQTLTQRFRGRGGPVQHRW